MPKCSAALKAGLAYRGRQDSKMAPSSPAPGAHILPLGLNGLANSWLGYISQQRWRDVTNESKVPNQSTMSYSNETPGWAWPERLQRSEIPSSDALQEAGHQEFYRCKKWILPTSTRAQGRTLSLVWDHSPGWHLDCCLVRPWAEDSAKPCLDSWPEVREVINGVF